MFLCFVLRCVLFFFKQKTAYEMRISDWSSDVCSSDLSPEIAEMEIIGRGGHLLPEMAVGEAYGVEEAPVRVEIIAFAVHQLLRTHGEQLDMLAARSGAVGDDGGRAKPGGGGRDPRAGRRDLCGRGWAGPGSARGDGQSAI